MNELRKDMNKAIQERFGSEYGVSDLKHTICLEIARRKREQGASPFTTFLYDTQQDQSKTVENVVNNVNNDNPFVGDGNIEG